MAKTYFRNVPDFNYVSRLEGQKNISEYIRVKNLFKRVRINESLFSDLTYFTKYKVVNDERPDQVAYKIYGTQEYDWIVLLSNNILNVQSEWPLSNEAFEKYMLEKYGSEDKFYTVHHYETKEITDSIGRIIVRAGLEVPSNYSISYYDSGEQITVTDTTVAVTNYEYETTIQDEIRNIYLIKPEYLNLVIQDIDTLMPVKPGSTQYVSDDLSQGDNIRLYS
jgi:hypothetical protein|tara:strand:- start:419 stop:1084 length:666 start_codon:yes stop_codon:yes gene_type:complete